MTPQERALLEDFLAKLAGVHGVDKDPEADALIRQQAVRQPDALYFTIQRSLLQEQALDAAQTRIQSLEQKVKTLEAAAQAGSPTAAPAAPRSFLSGLTAGGWGRAPEPPPAAAPSSYSPAAQPGSMIGSQIGARADYPAGASASNVQQPAVAAARPGLMGGGMGGFLGNAAAAAAGVAGGMFLFNGIEHLMNSGHDATRQAASGTDATPATESVTDNTTENTTENLTENVTNNYYNEPAPLHDDGTQDSTQVADAGAADDGGWFDDGGFFDGSGDDDLA